MQDKVLIGTSDIPIEDPDQAVITDQEVQYFINMVKRVFPTVEVSPSQIVFTFSGVRPLTNSKARFTGQISRDHQIIIDEPAHEILFPVYSLVGGKWTTYRAFSEKVSDIVLDRLGLNRNQSTRNYKIGGGKAYPKTKAEKNLLFSKILSQSNITEDKLEILFSQYGTKITEILEHVDIQSDSYLQNYPNLSVYEIKYIVKNEDIVHLDDFILRRSILCKVGQITPEGLAEICSVIAQSLDWNNTKSKQEINRVIEILKTRHRMNFNQFIQGALIDKNKGGNEKSEIVSICQNFT